MLTVGEIMSSTVQQITPDTSLGSVHQMMNNNRMRHATVVQDGVVVGIVSDRDVQRFWGLGPRHADVSRMMTAEPFTVRKQTTALRAAELLLKHKIGALPVVDDDGRPVGIVTETDLSDDRQTGASELM